MSTIRPSRQAGCRDTTAEMPASSLTSCQDNRERQRSVQCARGFVDRGSSRGDRSNISGGNATGGQRWSSSRAGLNPNIVCLRIGSGVFSYKMPLRASPERASVNSFAGASDLFNQTTGLGGHGSRPRSATDRWPPIVRVRPRRTLKMCGKNARSSGEPGHALEARGLRPTPRWTHTERPGCSAVPKRDILLQCAHTA